MIWVLVHLPHLLPPIVAFAFMARLAVWAADQPPQHFSDEQVAAWQRERAARRAHRRTPVRRGIARAGLWSLWPLVLCALSGLAIYTINIRSDRPSGLLIWSHVATSVAALGIVTAKALALGRRRLAAGLTLRRVGEAPSSLLLLGLGLPLTLGGGWLLVYPSSSSPMEYAHLILSVWWTLLLQWHLYRYLGRALTARRPEPAAGTGGSQPGTAD